MLKGKQTFQIVLTSAIAILATVAVVSAVTTISGSSISTGGAVTADGATTFNTLSVTGTSSLANLLYVNNGTGYVGIGTSTPDAKLDVNGTAFIRGISQFSSETYITNANTNYDAVLNINGTYNNINSALLSLTASTSRVVFSNGNLSGGQWGIGLNPQLSDTPGNDFIIHDILSSTNPFAILKTSGNVGIGTISPSAKLDVNGTFSAATSTISNLNFGVDSGSTDDYAITLSPAITSYTRGMQLTFIANTANTGVCTVNVNSLGAKSLKMKTNQDPTDNYIVFNTVVVAVYDGTNFQMIQPAAVVTAAETISVAKNNSFASRSSSNPTGAVGDTDKKIASLVITAGSSEGMNVTQIVLADNSSVEMGDNFQNLKIRNGSTQIGFTIASLNTTAGTYTFTPGSAINIAAENSYIIDVYADIKSGAANTDVNINPVIRFSSISAVGASSSNTLISPNAIDLQQAYISSSGNLSLIIDSSSPAAQQLIMGVTDQTLAAFKLTADSAENISITKIVLNDLMVAVGTGTIANLKLYDGADQIGSTVIPVSEYASTTYAVFSGLSLTVSAGTDKVITVKGDINTFDGGGVSGSTHEISIYPTYNGVNEPITAVGAVSGTAVTGSKLDIGGDSDVQVRGNQMTVYKTKITVAFASDTPSGTAVGGDDATVARINITNSANAGNYAATIKTLNFAISQTGISNTGDRELKIYKDSISGGNLLVTTSWLAVGNQNFGDTTIVDAVIDGGMTDVEISAGATKLFIITMDTQNAGTNDALSVNVVADDVEWSDGATGSITTVNSLPLSAKTLTY